MSRLPPGPRLSTRLDALAFWQRPLPFLEECAARWGDDFTVSLPEAPPWVVVSSPSAVRDLFGLSARAANAGETNAILAPVLGPGALLRLDGDRHLRERRRLLPAFHGASLRKSARKIEERAAAAIDSWPVGEPFPIHREMQWITSGIMARAVLGRDGSEGIRDLTARYLGIATQPALMLPWMRFGGAAEAPWKRLEELRGELNEAIDGIIHRRSAGPRHSDVLGALLGDGPADARSRRAVRDEVVALLAAGHETTATALSWCVHRLLRHPRARDAVLAEIRPVIRGGRLDARRVGRLHLLDATIRETLRLHTVVGDVARRLRRAGRLGSWDLPAGTVVSASAHLAHRRAASWSHPERFRPARFLEATPESGAYFPLGGGVRRCLGAAFASFEMKIILATLLDRVELRRVPGPIGVALRGLTLAPSPGIPVVVVRRRRPRRR